MKKATRKSSARSEASDMRDEYDFSKGVRGKYAGKFSEGTNLVLLAPDVASKFPTATSVNRALRELMKAKSKRRTA